MRDLEGITYTDTQTLRFTAGTKRNTKFNNNNKKGPRHEQLENKNGKLKERISSFFGLYSSLTLKMADCAWRENVGLYKRLRRNGR